MNGGRQEGNNRYKKMRKERRRLKVRKRGKFEQEYETMEDNKKKVIEKV